MKKLIILLMLLTIMGYNGFSQNYPPLRLENDVIVYGQLTVNGDSLFVDSIVVNNITVTGNIIGDNLIVNESIITKNNIYFSETGDTTDVNTWRYAANSDSLVISIFDGAEWSKIMKLIK